MKSLSIVFAFVMIFVMISGVIAAPKAISELRNEFPEETQTIERFVEGVASKKGIEINENTKVDKVDFDKLPENIKLDNIDDNNLAIYEVDDGEGEPVYVLTLSKDTFKKLKKSSEYRRMILNFGYSGIREDSGFLETATGVEGSVQKGYVMMRDGSITGMSTNLEVVSLTGGNEQIELIIYKNGKPSGFGNNLNAREGVQNDYDIQSEGILEFEAGDVISIYVNSPSYVEFGDITTLLEISVEE